MHMKRPEVACEGPGCEGCSSPSCMAKGGECMGPECSGCSSPDCYAKGGAVKGVHESFDEGEGDGRSEAGALAVSSKMSDDPSRKRRWMDSAKGEHKRVLTEMKDMPKPKLMAEGGMAEEGHDDGMDDEIKNMLGDELCSAFESKDKKRIMEGIEAVVLSVLSKG